MKSDPANRTWCDPYLRYLRSVVHRLFTAAVLSTLKAWLQIECKMRVVVQKCGALGGNAGP